MAGAKTRQFICLGGGRPGRVCNTPLPRLLFAVSLRYSADGCMERLVSIIVYINKKHLKNVGPIRHNEPPHADSADVASGSVARHLRIDVHNDNA